MNLRWKIITPLSRAEVEIVKPIVRPLGRQRVQRISNLSIHKSGDQNGESACSLPRLSLTKLLVSFGLLASVLVSIFMPSRAIASPDMTTGVTATATRPASVAPIPQAVPRIKGPAPLPPEEQGLPG